MKAPDPGKRQRQAADVMASVWVAASAGTGKTKVLTDRVLALLLAGSAPQRILCLTFTKAAAAEMAIRINDRLSRWTTEPDGALAQDLAALTNAMPDEAQLAQARRLFARVLDAPGGMRIETLHAFCQSLLRRFPIEADVAPHFEVMDERSAGEALAAAREEVLAAARQGGDADLATALAEVTRHVPEMGFDELMSGLALERARLRRALDGGHERFAAALCRLLRTTPGIGEDEVLAAACAGGACDEAALRQVAAALSASEAVSDQRTGARIARWLAATDARAAAFDDYLLAYFTVEGERRARLITKKLAEREPAHVATLSCEVDRLVRVIAERNAAALGDATGALIRLGDALLAAYEAHKTARALLDYDDLVLKACDLLRRPGVAPWVLFKLDGGLDHILIDEAQDTNPEQWQVVQALADEFFSGEGARPERRTVFAVGDAKQSIYSFQRADPEAFLRMREHFAERVAAARQQWRVVDLDISFRSTAAVLDAVDGVFARDAASSGVAFDGAPIHHTAFRAGQAGLVELWPPVEPEAPLAAAPWQPPIEQRQTREPRSRLALAIAATLRHWLASGERLPARGRDVRAGDVMVLVRRRGPFVTDLVRALKQANVPVAGVDRILLADQLAVQDMMALGQFLLLPEDDLTLATVLKGPLFGFDEEMLFDLAHHRGERRLWSELRRRASDHTGFAHAARELGELLARADFAPPYELFAEVLGARGGRRDTLARVGPEAADPLDEFLSMALAFERSHGPSLQGFLHWLATGEAEIKRDLDQRDRNEVRVLTVHGAKGLQAPVVFLPDTMQVPDKAMRLLWSEENLPLWHAHAGCSAPPWMRALAAAKQRREAEYRRLLYVALTRAEDRLYVCGWRNKKAPAEECWYHLVRDGLRATAGAVECDIDLTVFAGTAGWAGRGWRLEGAQQAAPRLDDRASPLRPSAGPLPEWARRPPDPEPSPARPLTPSAPRHADPAARSPLGSAEKSAGLLRGRLVHRLLQSLPDLPAAARRAAAERFLALPVHGLAAAAQTDLLDETLAVLDHPDFAPLFSPGSQAEVPLVGLVGHGRALAGQIDRLVVTEDEVLIVDYKTLRPPPLDEADVPEAYLDQLAAYRTAIAAIYPGRRVRCALLWTEGPRLMPISSPRLDRHAP
jgi:ATP-dependent helicase/nuclease subunit A